MRSARAFFTDNAKGWDLFKAARLGNACGAMVAGRHGCSVSMPTLDEVMAFGRRTGRALTTGFLQRDEHDCLTISDITGSDDTMPPSIAERFDLSGRVTAITGAGGALCGAMADALGAGRRQGGCDLTSIQTKPAPG